MKEYIAQYGSVDFGDGHEYLYQTSVTSELIRCKDCKYWGKDGYHNGCKYATCIMEENDYCSMGDRKEE